MFPELCECACSIHGIAVLNLLDAHLQGCMELVIGHGVSVQCHRSLRQGQREGDAASQGDLGFRIVLAGKNDQKKLRFEVYRPTADPNNRYSSRWGTLRDASWAFGDSDYCNVAVVQGAGEGTARATVTVGLTDAAGAERREMYVDARDLQPDEESGETTASTAYLERLMARGLNKLLEQTRTGSIEVELEDNALEPGDVAVCSLPELGFKATVRVANIITQSQMDGTTRTVRLGTPVWKKI